MGMVAFWTQPIATAIDFMRAAFRAAIETGDLTFACYSMYQSVTSLLLRNDPLDAVWRESERGLDFVRKARFGDVADIIVSQQRFIATMQGRTATFSTFSDAQFDEAAFEAQLTADRMPLMACWYWILKLKARFLSGDYAEALAAADKAKALLWSAAAADPAARLLLLYRADGGGAAMRRLLPTSSTGWRDLLTAHREQLREWAENYPPTFGRQARTGVGRDRPPRRAGPRRHASVRAGDQSARENGFVQNEGLAHEVAARFYAARGFETIAQAYLRNAVLLSPLGRDGQGAAARAVPPAAPRGPHPSHGAIRRPRRAARPGAVVKASQAVSGEIVFDRLIETLMTIALEHAGADAAF